MAFDGIVIANLTKELKETIEGGHVSKIAMPEKDELLLTVKNNAKSYRLLISSGASLPLMYLTDAALKSPLIAPGFCMLLRKHIGSGKITDISQSGLERIVRFSFEQLNELGDLCLKHLYVELMGKYSNIIFTDDHNTIIDSMKHVPSSLSSLREVLPGRSYFLPDQLKKMNPVGMNEEQFVSLTAAGAEKAVGKFLYESLSGISPVVSEEFCFLSGIDSRQTVSSLNGDEKSRLFRAIEGIADKIRTGQFSPCMYFRKDEPAEFSSVPLSCLNSDEYSLKPYDSASLLLSDFYSMKESITRMRQKSADLRKLVTNALERSSRKYNLQAKQLKDAEKKEKYRVYGDLLNTYGYELSGGEKEMVCKNFYDNDKEITVPLDSRLTASENASKYYERFSKLKRTEEAVSEEIKKTLLETEHLTSILASLDLSTEESDLNQIRDELAEYGYIRHRVLNGKKGKAVSRPLHFVSSDGFDIYVGKNNFQNEEITFHLATGNDWWFHAKGVPGSHVIVKGSNMEIPDRTFEEAASLAAYYSKARGSDKAEVDYIQKKQLRKTAGGPPGFVIYHTNWSMMAKPADRIPAAN
jgi:predicted ribosome quality control (RQC) complex YloA/Tae2 family protein